MPSMKNYPQPSPIGQHIKLKGYTVWGGPVRVIVIRTAYSWCCKDDVLRLLRERLIALEQAQHDVLRRVDTQ